MKTASKKMEIQLLERFFTANTDPNSPKELIKFLDTSPERYSRIESFIENTYHSTRELPEFSEFIYLLDDLRISNKKYFLGCSHSSSIFVKLFELESITTDCKCCTYWRGRISQFIFDLLILVTLVGLLHYLHIITFNF